MLISWQSKHKKYGHDGELYWPNSRKAGKASRPSAGSAACAMASSYDWKKPKNRFAIRLSVPQHFTRRDRHIPVVWQHAKRKARIHRRTHESA